jgi:hypothetical protein
MGGIDLTAGGFWAGLGLLLLGVLVLLLAPYGAALVSWFTRQTYGPAADSEHAVVRYNAQWRIAKAKVSAVWLFRGVALLLAATGVLKVLGG